MQRGRVRRRTAAQGGWRYTVRMGKRVATAASEDSTGVEAGRVGARHEGARGRALSRRPPSPSRSRLARTRRATY
eukprot:4738478-Prymnesium_polylepis.1